MAEVDADRAAITVTYVGLHAADHAGATAERDRRDPGVAAPLEHRYQFVLAARERHQIGRSRVLTAEGAHQIAKRLAVCVRGPLVRVRAERRLKRRRWRQPGCGQAQLLHSRRFLQAQASEPETSGEDGPE